MKIHFSGIGGIGISGLAQLCLSEGIEIQGSDLGKSEIWPVLETENIPLFLDQTVENITDDIDLLVYSEAVPETNPERVRAKELNIPQKSYFEYLGEKSVNFSTIAVAGTHGKTTTTALLAAGLNETSFDPSVIVGTTLAEFDGSNFQKGNSEFLVVEACEYRENFRFLQPKIVLLTGIEWDHIDAFPTEKSYYEAFANFVQSAEIVIYHADDWNAKEILKNFTGRKIAVPMERPLKLSVFGQFNQRNAQLALAAGTVLGVNTIEFAKGLKKFTGAGRRQEFLAEKNDVLFYDDYAHHPSEIRALLEGFREKFPRKKIGIVFEPHQFSRTKQFFADFVAVLHDFDKAAFYPIYAARDTVEDKKFDLEKELEKHPSVGLVQNNQDIDIFSADFSDGDVIVFCGAGNISGFARNYLEK